MCRLSSGRKYGYIYIYVTEIRRKKRRADEVIGHVFTSNEAADLYGGIRPRTLINRDQDHPVNSIRISTKLQRPLYHDHLLAKSKERETECCSAYCEGSATPRQAGSQRKRRDKPQKRRSQPLLALPTCRVARTKNRGAARPGAFGRRSEPGLFTASWPPMAPSEGTLSPPA